jgi:hypothetical protein
MKNVLSRVAVLAAVMCVAAEVPAGAQKKPHPHRSAAAVTLPATGTFTGGGAFAGTATINRFEKRGNDIVAVGLVTGVLSRGGMALGSTVAGEVTWPVAVRAGGQVLASGAVRKPGTPMPAVWSPDARSEFGLLRVQETCQVVDVALAPVNVDVLGVQIALSPITLNLTGGAGPLGELVCAASDLLGNVAGLVNLLNSVLGLLTGLLGGLTGGIGGIVPVP